MADIPLGAPHSQTDRQADRQPARQPGKQAGRQAGRQAGNSTKCEPDPKPSSIEVPKPQEESSTFSIG